MDDAAALDQDPVAGDQLPDGLVAREVVVMIADPSDGRDPAGRASEERAVRRSREGRARSPTVHVMASRSASIGAQAREVASVVQRVVGVCSVPSLAKKGCAPVASAKSLSSPSSSPRPRRRARRSSRRAVPGRRGPPGARRRRRRGDHRPDPRGRRAVRRGWPVESGRPARSGRAGRAVTTRPRIAPLLAGLPVEVLGRLRSDGVMRRTAPPAKRSPWPNHWAVGRPSTVASASSAPPPPGASSRP